MADQYIGEIRAIGFNFAPVGWALCDGQLLPIGDYPDLFTVIGNTYGGDGLFTFALPDLRGRSPIHRGQAPGLTPRTVGEAGGEEAVTLTLAEMPSHTHQVRCDPGVGGAASPSNQLWATVGGSCPAYSPVATAQMSAQALAPEGQSQPHNNRQPFLGINFIIALVGDFPSPV